MWKKIICFFCVQLLMKFEIKEITSTAIFNNNLIFKVPQGKKMSPATPSNYYKPLPFENKVFTYP